MLHIDVSFPAARAEPGRTALIALIALIVPALGEELVFRGVLQPSRMDGARTVVRSGLSLAAFVAWHPVQAQLGLPSAQAVFLDPAFLAMAGVLGLVCTALVHRSGSVWTAVFVHWAVVVVWKAGEPFPGPPGAG
ncbi:CPBP family glutamic-type intramembrane protease [Maricaulaceae bacterium MS644]